MEEKHYSVLTIGTLIQIGNQAGMIAGYDFRDNGDRLALYYLVLPYPKGYASEDDVRAIEAADCTPLVSGYSNQLSEVFVKGIELIAAAANKFPAEEIITGLQQSILEGER